MLLCTIIVLYFASAMFMHNSAKYSCNLIAFYKNIMTFLPLNRPSFQLDAISSYLSSIFVTSGMFLLPNHPIPPHLFRLPDLWAVINWNQRIPPPVERRPRKERDLIVGNPLPLHCPKLGNYEIKRRMMRRLEYRTL